MNGEFPYHLEQEDPITEEFKRTAFEILRDNEGCEYQDWIDMLVNQHGNQVVETLAAIPWRYSTN